MLRMLWSLTVAACMAAPAIAIADEPIEPNFDVAAFCSDCEPGCAIDDCGSSCGVACEPSCGFDPCCDPGCACEPSCGCEPGCAMDCCGSCCLAPWEHRTGVFGEWVYLHPVGADMHHAQQQNGTGGAGTTPFGEIASADPHHEQGVRIGGSIRLGACSSITGSYTFLETDSRSYIDIPGVGLQTGSLVHHPNAGTISSAGALNATYDINFQLADVMYRRLAMASRSGWLNYSVGFGYARMEQEFMQTGTFSGSQNGVINTTTEVDFDGYGLRLGLDGERKFGCGKFSGYYKANASALFGEFRGDYLMTNATTVSDLAIVRWEDDRVVPTLEYELGVAWTSCSGRTRASVGYTGMHFMNVATTPTFVDAVQADNYVDFGDTLSLEGLVTRIEFRY